MSEDTHQTEEEYVAAQNRDTIIRDGFPDNWFVQDRPADGIALLVTRTLGWPGQRCICVRPKLMATSEWVPIARSIAKAMHDAERGPLASPKAEMPRDLYEWLYPYVGDEGQTRILIGEMLDRFAPTGEKVEEVAWTEEQLREHAKAKGWYVRESASVPDLKTGGWRHPFSVTAPSRDILELLAALVAERDETRAGSPDDLRARGWAVAVHNDYRLNGEPYTFWLFTKDGRALKGEGRTDAEALNAVRAAESALATANARAIQMQAALAGMVRLVDIIHAENADKGHILPTGPTVTEARRLADLPLAALTGGENDR